MKYGFKIILSLCILEMTLSIEPSRNNGSGDVGKFDFNNV